MQTYQKAYRIFYLHKLHVACKIVSRFRESLLLFLGVSAGNSNTLTQRKFLQELVKHDIIKGGRMQIKTNIAKVVEEVDTKARYDAAVKKVQNCISY